MISHVVRAKGGGDIEIRNYARALAIKVMCTECMGWGDANPKDCTTKKCPLYPFRGKTQAAYRKDEEK